ncbi:uncharacterized protein LOC123870943 isoform X1 [Maniola jurtina]|uniref:uncharacterized protein LOC123870943 isoform X1 n=1 Tax=Maniola jurtina TaxID=191418 RepID=UPI001E6890EA|nr:uncharacterized protein LOC123870943 isoform X1 [Maniola jurtina]
MDKTQENKKCFCTRCFFPIESEDRVDIDGQNFHRICSMCCICRMLPTSLKMFYGHVFCSDCFKTHVMSRFKGDNPHVHSQSWWMQWGPGTKPQDLKNTNTEPETSSGEHSKRFICARCLQPVDDIHRITIGDQSFHAQCGQCYFCHKVPSTNLKIYYGQVFCEECFHRHVLSRNKDNPSEFFKNCFEQWQNSPQFADNMRDFMGGNRESTPFIFMMQGQQPPFCRCGTGPQGLFQNNEPRPNEARKSATPHTISFGEDSQSCDLSFENRTEVSIPESNEESAKQENLNVTAAEKIEKLTKYLHERVALEKFDKKWKFLDFESSMEESVCGWIDLHDQALSRDCPKCLWQCGPIYVNSKFYVQNQVV